MNWNNASDFFHMGGYGLYVWGSYAVTAVWMLAEPVMVRGRLKRAQTMAAELNQRED